MDRLCARDASFLYAETPNAPMHVAGLAIFDASAPGTIPFHAFCDHVAARLHLLPLLHHKLALTPLQLDQFDWVEDEGLDIEHHIRRTALSAPGTDAQLRMLVAQLHMGLLDRARALWQCHVIEGLEGGRFAVHVKIHRAACDDSAISTVLETIFSTQVHPAPVTPPPRAKTAPPDIFALIGESYAAFFNQQSAFMRAWPGLGMAPAFKTITPEALAPEQTAPKTIFNAQPSDQRSFGTCTLSRPQTEALGRELGATSNDVILGVSAGALRRYLQTREALPAQSLVAAIPVAPCDTDATDPPQSIARGLATDIADPLARLATFVASAKTPPERRHPSAPVPRMFAGVARLLGEPASASDNTAANVLIAIATGPCQPLFCAGAAMRAYYPVAGFTDDSVLGIGVQSTCERLDVGLIACRAAVPDIDRLADFFVEEFAALQAAVAPSPPAPAHLTPAPPRPRKPVVKLL